LFGFSAEPESLIQLTTMAEKTVTDVITLIGGITASIASMLAIIGRIVATKRIK
jgi:hypothetical protein